MKESQFGRYAGYTQPHYDDWQRNSRYVTLSDGVQVAIDIYLPIHHGTLSDESYPVLFRHNAHGRVTLIDDKFVTFADVAPYAQHFLRHGYALVISDPRGSGASFGINKAHEGEE